MKDQTYVRVLVASGIIAFCVLLYLGFSAGTAEAATVCQIANGCTGTSTTPSYGQVLVGNAAGGYSLTATSSLGIQTSGASTTALSDNNTFSGTDTFTQTIVGSVSGSAATALQLANTRTINGVGFNGTSNITVQAASSTALSDNNTYSGNDTFNNTITGSVSGNAGTASALQTSRNINGVPFNGTAPITVNAASSTLLSDNNIFAGTDGFINPLTAPAINATSSSATSTIENLGGQYWIPYNFSSVGCGGSASATEFGNCVHAIEEMASTSISSSGPVAIQIIVPDIKVTQAQWTNELLFNIPGEIVSFDCVNGATLQWGGVGTSTDFNMANGIGHLKSDDYGCTYMGQSTLIAAGNTNNATSTGVAFGGSSGAVGVTFHNNNINGYGQDVYMGQNSYMLSIENNAISGGDGTSTFPGSSLYEAPASNSGERVDITNNTFTDPGNNYATSSVYISQSAAASNFITGNSFDDAQLNVMSQNGEAYICANHFENSDASAYGIYVPIYGSNGNSTLLYVCGNMFANDSSANSWQYLVLHGNILYMTGNMLDNYGNGTVAALANHSLNNGAEGEMVCDNAVVSGTLTNIVSNQAYSAAAAVGCSEDYGNSYPWLSYIDSSNVVHFRNGNTDQETIGSTGNITLGSSAENNTITVYSKLAVGTSTTGGTATFASNSSNATTSVEIGKPGQNKGSCLTYFDTAGTPVYAFWAAGQTTPTYTSTLPSGCTD